MTTPITWTPYRDGLLAVVGRAVCKVYGRDRCCWSVALHAPYGGTCGIERNEKAAKRAALRWARREIGEQAWREAT